MLPHCGSRRSSDSISSISASPSRPHRPDRPSSLRRPRRREQRLLPTWRRCSRSREQAIATRAFIRMAASTSAAATIYSRRGLRRAATVTRTLCSSPKRAARRLVISPARSNRTIAAESALSASTRQGVGKDVGERFSASLLEWFVERGIHHVSVVTQGRNTDALSFYQAHGFDVVRIEPFYHRWSTPTESA